MRDLLCKISSRRELFVAFREIQYFTWFFFYLSKRNNTFWKTSRLNCAVTVGWIYCFTRVHTCPFVYNACDTWRLRKFCKKAKRIPFLPSLYLGNVTFISYSFDTKFSCLWSHFFIDGTKISSAIKVNKNLALYNCKKMKM